MFWEKRWLTSNLVGLNSNTVLIFDTNKTIGQNS